MESDGDGVTEGGVGGGVQPHQQQEVGGQQAAAQVRVDGGGVTLEARHAAENPDT